MTKKPLDSGNIHGKCKEFVKHFEETKGKISIK